MDKHSVVSLFSGAGGFDLGFQMAEGGDLLLANDLKVAPVQTLSQHFSSDARCAWVPFRPSMDDLPVIVKGDVEGLDLSGLVGLEPDVLIGGPPCQEFSVMQGQNRNGIQVEGGRLYRHFVRAISLLSPKIFVFENVHGLVSANKRRAHNLIEEHLSNPANDSGTGPQYNIVYNDIVDSTDIGVPQTRRRLIIIGVRRDVISDLSLFERKSLEEEINYRLGGGGRGFRTYPLTCMEVFEGKPLTELEGRYHEVLGKYASLAEDMPGHEPAQKWVAKNVRKGRLLEDYLRVNSIQRNLFSNEDFERAMEEHMEVLRELGYLGVPVSDLELEDKTSEISEVSSSVSERMWRTPPGENYSFTSNTEWDVEGSGLSLIYRRPHPLSPAPTVVAHGGGGTYGYHYERSRNMLTNRERARLQTFPDDFFFSGGVSDVRKQIGEAVPPLLAKRVAEELRPVLSIV